MTHKRKVIVSSYLHILSSHTAAPKGIKNEKIGTWLEYL